MKNAELSQKQQAKLDALRKTHTVYRHYVNPQGQLVIIMSYGSKYYCRQFVGVRGGFAGSWIYKGLDTEMLEPFGLIHKEY